MAKAKTCIEWTSKVEPCGAPATQEYDLNTALTRIGAKYDDGKVVKPHWLPVCDKHAKRVVKHYGFAVRPITTK